MLCLEQSKVSDMKIADNASIDDTPLEAVKSLHARAYPRCPPRSPKASFGGELTKWGVHQKCAISVEPILKKSHS